MVWKREGNGQPVPILYLRTVVLPDPNNVTLKIGLTDE